MIDTIFYFANNITDYNEAVLNGGVNPRTIVFVASERAIYKNGVLYGKMTDDDIKNAIARILDDDKSPLPIATRESIGAIMVGDKLAINSTTGKLSVDINALLSDPNVINLLNLITNTYITNNPVTNVAAASAAVLGGIKLGYSENGKNYAVKLDGNDRAYVTVDWEVLKGDKGDPGTKGDFKSRVFVRSVSKPDTPTGGTYENPIPTGWYDSIPQGTNPIWSSVCTFYGAGGSSGWSEPVKESDTATLDIEFSPNLTQPEPPYGSDASQKDSPSYIEQRRLQGWYDPSNLPLGSLMIWRAERKIKDNVYSGDWVITRIYGEKGDTGAKGDKGDKGDPGTPGAGFDPTTDPTILEINRLLAGLRDDITALLRNQGSGSSTDINTAVNTVISVLNAELWQSLFNSSGFDPGMAAYLTRVGLITLQDIGLDGKITTLTLSQIIQNMNSIQQTVNGLSIGTDGNGNQVNIEQIKSEIILQITSTYALSTMQSAINQWPATMEINGQTVSNPTIFSALSYTKNLAENTKNGLQSLYQQYAGVISKDNYTLSLILGLANEKEARTSLSSAFGEYEYDQYGNPVYETWPNGDEVYEVDEEGHAIPYTGIKLMYVDAQGNFVDSAANAATVYAADGITPLYDESGNVLKKLYALKVYYKSDGYGNFVDTNHYYLAENYNNAFISDSTNPAQFNDNDRYMDGYLDNNGNIIWHGDDGHVDPNVPGSGATFINLYGYDKIAYHKTRKFMLTNYAGIITEANKDSAIASLFAANALTTSKSTIAAMVASDNTFLSAVAQAVGAQGDSVTASAKLVADASIYEAYEEYSSDNGETWITIDEQHTPSSGDLTRIKRDPNTGAIIWKQDTDDLDSLLWIAPDGSIVTAGEDVNGTTLTDANAESLGCEPKRKLLKQAQAGVITTADLDNAQSELYAKLDDKYAGITVTAGTGGTSVKTIANDVLIIADSINLNGSVTFIDAIGDLIAAKRAIVSDKFATGDEGGLGFVITQRTNDAFILSGSLLTIATPSDYWITRSSYSVYTRASVKANAVDSNNNYTPATTITVSDGTTAASDEAMLSGSSLSFLDYALNDDGTVKVSTLTDYATYGKDMMNVGGLTSYPRVTINNTGDIWIYASATKYTHIEGGQIILVDGSSTKTITASN